MVGRTESEIRREAEAGRVWRYVRARSVKARGDKRVKAEASPTGCDEVFGRRPGDRAVRGPNR